MFISNSFSLSLNVNQIIFKQEQKNQRLAIAIGCIAGLILFTGVVVYKIYSHFWLNRKITSESSSTKENQPQNSVISEIEPAKKLLDSQEAATSKEDADKEKAFEIRSNLSNSTSSRKYYNPMTPIISRIRNNKQEEASLDSEDLVDDGPFIIVEDGNELMHEKKFLFEE